MDRDYEAEAQRADDEFTDWLESLTEGELATRHFLLDKEGVPASLHWFDWPHGDDYNDDKGRLDTEKCVFHYRNRYGGYSMSFPTPVKNSRGYLYVLVGTEGVVGEIRVEKD